MSFFKKLHRLWEEAKVEAAITNGKPAWLLSEASMAEAKRGPVLVLIRDHKEVVYVKGISLSEAKRNMVYLHEQLEQGRAAGYSFSKIADPATGTVYQIDATIVLDGDQLITVEDL